MMVSIEELEEATSEDLSPAKGLLPTQVHLRLLKMRRGQ